MTAAAIQNIDLIQMVICYLLFLFSFLLITRYRLKLEKDALLATLRMSLQLVLAGLILKYIFKFNLWYVVLFILLIMIAFAAHTVIGRVKLSFRDFFPILFLSLLIGCGGTMIFFIFLVVRQSPWYDARYLIPLFGMIVGNSMSGCALALERYISGMREDRDGVEAILSFGGTPAEAAQNHFLKAFRASILPTLASMTGMGLVFLPGMMTGQILSGAEPFLAVKYQIAIMLAILSSTVFSSFLIIKLQTRRFFNRHDQLVDF